jgi:hypothetical protein
LTLIQGMELIIFSKKKNFSSPQNHKNAALFLKLTLYNQTLK